MPVRRAAALLALVLPLAACQATARVTLTVGPRSAGDVAVSLTLDRQAAQRVGNVASALRTADLQRHGWVLEPVTAAADGSVTATVHHPFSSLAEAGDLLAEVGGPAVRITVARHAGVLSSRTEVAGAVDLTRGLDTFADARLAQGLGAPSVSSLVDQVRAAGGATPAVGLALFVRLPGVPRQVAQGGVVSGDTVRWTLPLGARTVIGASAHATDRSREEWLAAAVGFLVLALVTALVCGRRRSRRHRDSWALQGPVRR